MPNLHSVRSSCATFQKASIESSNQDFFLWCYSLLLKKEQRGHLHAWSRQPQLPRCLLYIFRLPTLLNLGTYRVSTYLPYVMAVHCKYIQCTAVEVLWKCSETTVLLKKDKCFEIWYFDALSCLWDYCPGFFFTSLMSSQYCESWTKPWFDSLQGTFVLNLRPDLKRLDKIW